MGATSDESAGLEIAAGDEIESFAAHGRGVVEGRAKSDVAVVNAIGVQVDVRADCAAAEEVNRAAFSNHLEGFFPGFRNADGFNGDVDTAIVGRESARFADGFANAAGLDDVFRTELTRCFNLPVVLDDSDGFASGESSDVEHHQAERAAADDGDGGAGKWL